MTLTAMRKTSVLIASAALFASGCAEMFPDKSATGIARLTVRNVGAVATMVSSDTACGFESPDVLASPVIEGEVGGDGVVIWKVHQCLINPKDDIISVDCNGVTKKARGEIIVTAEKRIVGRITGDATTPVIPAGPDAVEIRIIEAAFSDFRVEASDSDSAMTNVDGSIAATVSPKLAAAQSNGTCSVPTLITTFSDISYAESNVAVESPALSFGALISGSNLQAQNGPNHGDENTLSGTISVFGGDKQVPNDTDGLDPAYDQVIFHASYACNEDIAWPVTFECDLTQSLGEGAARLSMQTFAGLVAAINDDATCGFSSQQAGASLTSIGTVGDRGGSATVSVENCVLEFDEPTVLSTNCDGVETVIQGTAIVSGTKTLHGILTGDPAEPVIPTDRDPATISISADMTDMTIGTDANSLNVASGTLSGAVQPRTALDVASGACSKATPVAEIADIQWTDADVQIIASGMTLGLHIDSSNLKAVNGRKGASVNTLDGKISVDGQGVAIAGKDLDPDYDPAAFDAAYQCDADMLVPMTDAECDFSGFLAQNAARLLIKTFGNVVKSVDADESCGFKSMDGIVPGAAGAADVGSEITAMWDVNNCTIGGGAPFLLFEDCNGKQTWIHGAAHVTATKSASGDLALGYPPILPRSRTSARFDVHSVALDEFAVVEYLAGATDPEPYMVVHSATVTGIGRPITGEAADTPGAYFVPIPISGFERVQVSNAEVTIYADAKQLNLTINGSDLNAFNGSFNSSRNLLDGAITIDGATHTVPVRADDSALDPEYDQGHFNDSYACYENLAGLVPWE